MHLSEDEGKVGWIFVEEEVGIALEEMMGVQTRLHVHARLDLARLGIMGTARSWVRLDAGVWRDASVRLAVR